MQVREQEALGQYERNMEAFKEAEETVRGDLQTLAQSLQIRTIPNQAVT